MTHICVMSSHKNLYGGLILGVNTLCMLFCFFKLFTMVGKGLIKERSHWFHALRILLTVSVQAAINAADLTVGDCTVIFLNLIGRGWWKAKILHYRCKRRLVNSGRGSTSSCRFF